MSQEQLAEIEARWWNPFRLGDLPKNGLDDVSDLLAEVRRLNRQNTEQKKVVDATFLYMKNINSPLCIGWDNLLDAMQSYRKYLESEVADNG